MPEEERNGLRVGRSSTSDEVAVGPTPLHVNFGNANQHRESTISLSDQGRNAVTMSAGPTRRRHSSFSFAGTTSFAGSSRRHVRVNVARSLCEGLDTLTFIFRFALLCVYVVGGTLQYYENRLNPVCQRTGDWLRWFMFSEVISFILGFMVAEVRKRQLRGTISVTSPAHGVFLCIRCAHMLNSLMCIIIWGFGISILFFSREIGCTTSIRQWCIVFWSITTSVIVSPFLLLFVVLLMTCCLKGVLTLAPVNAAGDVLEKMTSETYQQRVDRLLARDLSGETTCSVCLEDYLPADPIVSFPCDERHFLHKECASACLRVTSHCPFCRQDARDSLTAKQGGTDDVDDNHAAAAIEESDDAVIFNDVDHRNRRIIEQV